MQILIAEDDNITRRLLESMLKERGYDVICVANGNDAWEHLQRENHPQLVLLDWMMPGMDGVEVCRKLRARSKERSIYVILLTSRDRKEDIVSGLQAGADDYLVKPFDKEELHARLAAGTRVIDLENQLAERIQELEKALSLVKHLRGLLPICSYCKKIRNDENYWQQVEEYISKHSEAEFSHGICPECFEKHVKPQIERIERRK